MKEDLARVGLPGWSLIGVLEAGVNPYSGMFVNGPRSLADNNPRPARDWISEHEIRRQSCRAVGNSQGYLGIGDPVYGTLTFGRTNSLALERYVGLRSGRVDGILDAGFLAAFSGFGSSPSVRPNTAVTYRLTYQKFRAGVQARVGATE